MVLRPIFDPDPVPTCEFVAAWNAVEEQQRAKANAWWLITQPEHAALSGEIAANFGHEDFPSIDPTIVSAIAKHDAGWNLFESDPDQPPRLHLDGRPLSFFEVEPQSFLRAWAASIEGAQEESAKGGYMVSQHFAWLGEYRLKRAGDPPEVQDLIRNFLAVEHRRQLDLQRGYEMSGWNALLPLLQFCDLFSLYLCCGSRQSAEFPQPLPGHPIRARFDGNTCVLTPTPFAAKWSAMVRARHYPVASDNKESFLSVAVK
jgi:Protein of unknown function (DUF3891)